MNNKAVLSNQSLTQTLEDALVFLLIEKGVSIINFKSLDIFVDYLVQVSEELLQREKKKLFPSLNLPAR